MMPLNIELKIRRRRARRQRRKAAKPRGVAALGSAGRLLADSVRADASLILAGFYRQAHLLVEGSAEETADAVVLPECDLGDLGQGCALRAAQEFQDRGFLRSFARSGCRLGRLLAGALRPFLGGGPFLRSGFLRPLIGHALLLAGSIVRGGLGWAPRMRQRVKTPGTVR